MNFDYNEIKLEMNNRENLVNNNIFTNMSRLINNH